MSKISEQDANKLSPANVPRALRSRRWVSLFGLVTGYAVLVLTMVLSSGVAASTEEDQRLNARGFNSTVTPAASGDYSKFAHGEAAHARLPCLLCHRRDDNSPRPKLPGHVPCSGCHTPQFADASSPICSICHTDVQAGAVKLFPSLKSFNARFEHARHKSGASHPRAGCAACHKPVRRGVGLSIPAGMSAHLTCFQCHTSNARSASGDNIDSCSTCHQLANYARTPVGARAYKVNFSHAEHGARRGLSCNSCHQVRSGMPQGRQVASPASKQHLGSARGQSCMTCHNDKRAFGGDNFTSCQRCHEGKNFGF